MWPYRFTILLLSGFVKLLSVVCINVANGKAVVEEVGPTVHTQCGPVEGEHVNGVYSFQVGIFPAAFT